MRRDPISAGEPGRSWATVSERASSSSAAAKPVSTTPGRAEVASARLGRTSSPVVTCAGTGTVRKTAEETKASVPSEPTTRWASTSAGVSKSSSALMP